MRTILVVLFCLYGIAASTQQRPFQSLDSLPEEQPWTHLDFNNDPLEFQFAIVGDRTGGHRAGIFRQAVQRLNLINPEFVMCVGDLIEGYSRDSLEVSGQWKEFASLVAPLEAPFFFLPGNHDVSNKMMQRQWVDRYGATYYSFVYKEVLFIAMDSNDGDGVTLSEKQVDYVTRTLAENTAVRWTLLFMHHPVWHYQDVSGFQQIEKALEGRKYTVIAGHNHHYLYETRNSRNYYILATTGGGSRLRGPRFGEFDHITWVTMTRDQGPVLVHLQLDGVFSHDVVTPQTATLSQQLINSTAVKTALFYPQNEGQEIQALLLFQNDAQLPLQVDARFFHHHQVNPSESTFAFTVPARGQIQIPLMLHTRENLQALDPLQLKWTMHYGNDSLQNMSLDGVYDIFWDSLATHLVFQSDDRKFLDNATVTIDYPFEGARIKYTTDGSDPYQNGQVYTGPFTLRETATVKAIAVRNGQPGGVATAFFEKVRPIRAVKAKPGQPGLHFAYYEGEWERIPDFEALKPVRKGTVRALNIPAVAGDRQDHFGIRYRGFLLIPEDGLYTFTTISDDGSKLYLHEQLVVENDGSHSTRTRSGSIALKKGLHPIEIHYFEDVAGERLDVQLAGPGMETRDISFDHLFTE